MRIVVTGASRGIGLGLVRNYLDRGATVHAAARQPDRSDELHRLVQTSGGRLHIHRVDVTADKDVDALARDIGHEPVDVLFNNAGIGSRFGKLSETSTQDCLAAFDTNALGPLRVARALLANVVAARGKIVNISTVLASMNDNLTGRNYPYRMSKAALNMATRNLANELREAGVAVVALHPGWVRTEMGGPKATTPVEQAVVQIVNTVERLDLGQSGGFLGPQGEIIAW